MKFQDYYETLGVSRGASQEEIQKAFRARARKLHPDVNKSPGAEEQFKQLNEAYEVLRDPEKRSRYDALGANWKHGQEFRPPPGWEQQFGGQAFSGQGFGGAQFHFGGFSDFFEALFGQAGFAHPGAGGRSFGQSSAGPFEFDLGGMGGRRAPDTSRVEATLPLTVEELYGGASKTFSLTIPGVGSKTLQVKIPPGTKHGTVIRLAGQGAPRPAGGGAGDLHLKVAVSPHPRYRIEGYNLVVNLPIAPWEAALGGKVDVQLPAGVVRVTVPAGAQSGQRLRLKGMGLLKGRSERGDAFAELSLVVPRTLSGAEREAFQRLAEVSAFNPRA